MAIKFPENVDGLSHEELKKLYGQLRQSRNGMKEHNDRLSRWAESVSNAVTTLSVDGSLAFQLMAEKASVRSHPSVTKVVELFDAIAHPQWHDQNKVMPKVEFPTSWDLDLPESQSGDADMSLNSPIAEAIELLEHLVFRVPKAMKDIHRVTQGLQVALDGKVEGVKDKVGFRPLHLKPLDPVHFKDATREQLQEWLSAIGWMALDIAQDMSFANEVLRRDLRAASYRQVCSDLYRLSQLAIEIEPSSNFDIKVFDGEEIPF